MVVEDEINGKHNVGGNEVDDDSSVEEPRSRARPCELYVCNLPRSFDISELLEMFKPFGTVLSVEVPLIQLEINNFIISNFAYLIV